MFQKLRGEILKSKSYIVYHLKALIKKNHSNCIWWDRNAFFFWSALAFSNVSPYFNTNITKLNLYTLPYCQQLFRGDNFKQMFMILHLFLYLDFSCQVRIINNLSTYLLWRMDNKHLCMYFLWRKDNKQFVFGLKWGW